MAAERPVRRGGTVGASLVGLALTDALAGILLPKGLPPGVVVQGLVVGGLVSLTAMGLVLVYRAARVINFAQAAIGSVGAGTASLAMLGWQLGYVPSVVLGIAVSALAGVMVDAVVVRRLREAPRLILTVATIGVMELLWAVGYVLPHLASRVGLVAQFTTPFRATFHVRPLLFTGDDVVALAAVPVVALGLWAFLTRSEHGVAVRAVAESAERAQLLGIPVRRVSRLVWGIAGALSGLGAVLTVPVLHTQVIGVTPSPAELLPALAAAVLARFESLPAAVAWSLGIGVLQQGVFWSYAESSRTDVALLVLVLVGVAFQRRRQGRADDADLGDHVAVRAVHPVPAVLARLPEVRAGRVVVVVALLGAAVVVPLTLAPSDLDLLTVMAVFGLVAVSLTVVSGWSGQISLGQFGIAGVGAVATQVLLVHGGADFFVCLLAAAVAGAAVAAAIGVFALRVPGMFLAAASLAFAVAVSTWLLSSAHFPFLNPAIVPKPVLFGRVDLGSPAAYYELCLAVLVLGVLLARNLRRSRSGRALVAVRDNARGAAAFGIGPMRQKVLAFSVSGALAGVAGGLYVVHLGGFNQGIDPNESINAFVMVVIGGLGSMTGALLGAGFVESMRYFLSGGELLFSFGVGILVPVLVFPEGLGGAVTLARDRLLRVVARRHGVPLDVAVAPPGLDTPRTTPARSSRGTTTGAGDGGSTAGPADAGSHAPAESAVAGSHAPAESAVAGAPVATGTAAPAGAPLLAVRSLEVAIGQVRILADVTLEVAPGEIVAVLGTNGAGKSTTLRTIAGVLPARGGSIEYAGRDIAALGPEHRVAAGIVMVPGGRGVFPGLTVAENLRMAGWLARRQGDRRALADATVQVHQLFPRLRQRLDTRAGLLSGGEQQMLAIALALLCSPTVLMIDELSLGLAPSVVAQLLDVVRALAARGVAVVVVEQSVNLAAALARRAVFLERGTVRFTGPTAQLQDRTDLLRSVFLGAHVEDVPRVPVAGPRVTVHHQAQGAAEAGRQDIAAGVGSDGTQDTEHVPALALVSVAKQFGGLAALSGVSLVLRPGEILGVIGANGAGKTTLLDVCSGFTLPDRGRVLVHGHDVTTLPPAVRGAGGLGRVFQDARLFPSMTVADVLAVALERHVPVRDPFLAMWRTYAVAQSERVVAGRVEELLDEFGLGPFRDRFVYELSTGTRRVLQLACAVAHAPSVLLLDEPTSGLAQRESEALGPRLVQLRQRTGAAFVVVEHDVPLVSSIADRLVCLHLGEVVAEGSPRHVLGDPAVLASFLGSDEVAVARSGTRCGTR